MSKILQKKFWQKRHNQMNDEIATNLHSLYTWAMCLDSACVRRDQWRSDKKHVTGTKSIKYPDNNERSLAKSIIDFVLDGTLEEATTCGKHIRKLASTVRRTNVTDTDIDIASAIAGVTGSTCVDVVDADVEVVVDANGDIEIEVIGDTKTEELNAFTAVVDKAEKQQEILTKHMDARRDNLQAQEYDLSELSSIPEPAGRAVSKSVKFLINTVDDTVTRQGNLLGTVPPVPEELVLNETNDDDVIIDGKKYRRKPLDVRKDPVYKFAGIDKGSPEEQSQKAPNVSPLLSLSPRQRNDLYYNLFQKATHNVNSMTTHKDMSSERRDNLIKEESDRLLNAWIEANQFYKK